MARCDTPKQVKRWFQWAFRALWPVAMGPLSLRNSPCIREHCWLCESAKATPAMHCMFAKGDGVFRFTCRMNSLLNWSAPSGMAGTLPLAARQSRVLQGFLRSSRASSRWSCASERHKPPRSSFLGRSTRHPLSGHRIQSQPPSCCRPQRNHVAHFDDGKACHQGHRDDPADSA